MIVPVDGAQQSQGGFLVRCGA